MASRTDTLREAGATLAVRLGRNRITVSLKSSRSFSFGWLLSIKPELLSVLRR